jgi:hypothetical protein
LQHRHVPPIKIGFNADLAEIIGQGILTQNLALLKC